MHERLYPDFVNISAGGFAVPWSCLDKDMTKQQGSQRSTAEQRSVGSMSLIEA